MEVINACHNLIENGEYRQAEETITRLLERCLQGKSGNAVMLARIYLVLFTCQMYTKSYNQCLATMRAAEKTLREAFGAGCPFLTTVYSNMAICHIHTGNYGEAIGMLNRARSIVDKDLVGPTASTITATIHHQLGYIADIQGDVKQAMDCYQKAARLRRLVDPRSAELARTSYNLAELYRLQCAYDLCEKHHHEALDIREFLHSSKPEMHAADLARSEYRLALLCVSKNNGGRALDFARRSVRHFSEVLPAKHQEMLAVSGLIDSIEYGNRVKKSRQERMRANITLPEVRNEFATL